MCEISQNQKDIEPYYYAIFQEGIHLLNVD